MAEIGYKLSSEEHGPRELVRYAQLAEEAGFTFGSISDHFHPWIDKQGQSPFVWGVIGGIAQVTDRFKVGTGVTCPTIRIHPTIVAQAAATAAAMLPGRFFLGVGTGENLNEHVLGDRWPGAAERREMLEEAMQVMRGLWKGGNYSHRGRYYTVENARIYSLPDEPVPVYIAASGDKALELAGREGDGFIGLSPDAEMVQRFDSLAGAGKPKLCEVQVCWHEDEGKAIELTQEWWPNAGLGGELAAELPLPRHFEQAVGTVRPDDFKDKVALGPDPEQHLEMINKYVDAGYTHVAIHQIGPDQTGFFDFYRTQVLPKLS